MNDYEQTREPRGFGPRTRDVRMGDPAGALAEPRPSAAPRQPYTFAGPGGAMARATRGLESPVQENRILALPQVRTALDFVQLAATTEDPGQRENLFNLAYEQIQELTIAADMIGHAVREVAAGTTGMGAAHNPPPAPPAPPAHVQMAAARSFANPPPGRPPSAVRSPGGDGRWNSASRPMLGSIDTAPSHNQGIRGDAPPPGYDPTAIRHDLAVKDAYSMAQHHNQGYKGQVHPHPEDPSKPVDPMNPDGIALAAGGDALDPENPPEDTQRGAPVARTDPRGAALKASGETSTPGAAGGPTQPQEPAKLEEAAGGTTYPEDELDDPRRVPESEGQQEASADPGPAEAAAPAPEPPARKARGAR